MKSTAFILWGGKLIIFDNHYPSPSEAAAARRELLHLEHHKKPIARRPRRARVPA